MACHKHIGDGRLEVLRLVEPRAVACTHRFELLRQRSERLRLLVAVPRRAQQPLRETRVAALVARSLVTRMLLFVDTKDATGGSLIMTFFVIVDHRTLEALRRHLDRAGARPQRHQPQLFQR